MAPRDRSWSPGGVAPDERDETVLRWRVVGDRDLRAEVAAAAEQLVHRLYRGERLGAPLRAEVEVDVQGAGEVPGVHPHVARVELRDRVRQRHLAEHRAGVDDVALLLEHPLDLVAALPPG